MTSLKDLTNPNCILSAIDQLAMKNSIFVFIHKSHIKVVPSPSDIIVTGDLAQVITRPIIVNIDKKTVTIRTAQQALAKLIKNEGEGFRGPLTEIE